RHARRHLRRAGLAPLRVVGARLERARPPHLRVARRPGRGRLDDVAARRRPARGPRRRRPRLSEGVPTSTTARGVQLFPPMSATPDVDPVSILLAAKAELTAPGGGFEMRTETVRGHEMRVLAPAPPSMRALWEL